MCPSLVIKIPGVPPSDLLPNRIRNNHWAVYNRLRQEQKADAKYHTLAMFNGAGSPLPADAYPDVSIHVMWPKGRTIADLDNLAAGIKGALDGIFLALERDDKDMASLCIRQTKADPATDDNVGWVEYCLTW